jgi:DNA-binding NarL/FixJ family response regulator
MIRLLLVDDQNIVRKGLKVLLEAQPGFQVVGEAGNGREAIAQVDALQPDVVLMDVRMPEMDGVAATQAICLRYPEIRVLVLSTFDADDYVSRAIEFGAKGYLLKDSQVEDLAQAIRAVHRGFTQFGPGIFEKAITPVAQIPLQPIELPPGLADLTPREREVLCFIIDGSSNREIAEALYISERTVKNHVTSILSRINQRDRIHAARFASPFLDLIRGLF